MNSSLTFENYQRQRTGRTRRRSNRASFLGFTRGSIVEVVRFSGERGKRNRIDFIISFVRLHFLIQQYRKFCFCFSRWLRDSCAVELEAEKASTDGVQRISLCPIKASTRDSVDEADLGQYLSTSLRPRLTVYESLAEDPRFRFVSSIKGPCLLQCSLASISTQR